jgi:hypothetical protein
MVGVARVPRPAHLVLRRGPVEVGLTLFPGNKQSCLPRIIIIAVVTSHKSLLLRWHSSSASLFEGRAPRIFIKAAGVHRDTYA